MLIVSEIKNLLNNAHGEDIPAIAEQYKGDSRAGVRAAVSSALKRYNKYTAEMARLEEISFFEKKFYAEGAQLVGGIDEVGRGPLAGPVVTACVILPKDCRIEGINDSKKLTAKKREELYDVIIENAVSYGIGIVDHTVIDEINILQATYRAMRQAIESMPIKPDMLLVDAVTIPDIDVRQVGIVKGDARSISIGAASIVAKVTRDRMMTEFAEKYPYYDFESNMGYGTAKHIEGIKKYGLCDIHRRTFVKNFVGK